MRLSCSWPVRSQNLCGISSWCGQSADNIDQRKYDQQRKDDASKSTGNVPSDVIPTLESPTGNDLLSIGWHEDETPAGGSGSQPIVKFIQFSDHI